MAVPVAVREAYDAARPHVDELARYVAQTLRTWAQRRDYAFSDRTKELESLAEKLESGRYNRWSEVDDLYACTIVVPTARHEEDILSFLGSVFAPVRTRTRRDAVTPPDVFRFNATRFWGRAPSDAPISDIAKATTFEVQIATAFEHAWGIATHDLVYKSDRVDWRRMRLAASLKASVEQLDLLLNQFELAAEGVVASDHPETHCRRVLVDTFVQLLDDGLISEELAPRSWTRFSENVYALVRTRRGNTVEAVRDLGIAIDEGLRGGSLEEPPLSASLFQFVLSVASGRLAMSLDRFVVVDSIELRDFLAMSAVPRPFVFDN